MKRSHLVLGLLGLGLTCAAAPAGAAIRCTTADYAGVYAFYTNGLFLAGPPAGQPIQFAQAGVFNSDGAGNITVESTAVYNGQSLPANVPGTYSITPNCEITYTVQLPPPLSVTSTFGSVLSHSMKQNTVMITDPPGTVIVGHHGKLDRCSCTNADFKGGYQIDLTGSIQAPAGDAAPHYQMIGRLASDGAGNFSFHAFSNHGGHIVVKEFDGTYSVGSNCFVTLTESGGSGWSASGALAGTGDSAMVVVTTPGWTVAGELGRQQ